MQESPIHKRVYTINLDVKKGVPVPETDRLSRVNAFYKLSADKPSVSVYEVMTPAQVVDRLNNLNKVKKQEEAILRGVYQGGTKGEFCTKTAALLPFDVDIDKKENIHLLKQAGRYRQVLLDHLRDIAVIVYQSHSGAGLAGWILVPNISDFTINEKAEYKKAAELVYRRIEKDFFDKTKIEFHFDNSQGAFRQIRNLAKQEEIVFLNPDPTAYVLDIKSELSYLAPNIPQYINKSPILQEGSVREKFNADNPIEGLLPAAGFSKTGDNQYGHFNSSSPRSAVIMDDGTFMVLSQTYDPTAPRPYDSFNLYMVTNHLSYPEMVRHCKDLGYTNDDLNVDDYIDSVDPLWTPEQIYNFCVSLKHQKTEFKKQFLATASIPKDKVEFYTMYLGVKDLAIRYDEEMSINKWVSEVASKIFDLADSKKKVVIAAETGSGKTTSIIEEFYKLRPNKKMLVIAPLTAIVDQSDGVTPKADIIRLRGTIDDPSIWMRIKVATVVVATHKHAEELLRTNMVVFDYIVRDEIHSDILQNGFRRNTIMNLNAELEFYSAPVIALTGTPSNILTKLGFYMVKIKSNNPKNHITQRIDNRQSLKIMIQHHSTVKKSDKIIYRANSKKDLYAFQRRLLSTGYKKGEVVVFESHYDVKTGEDYQRLVGESIFGQNVKVVLTTSVLDEGVSIKNKDFTQIVYVGSEYRPRPEPLKQFLNRFREKSDGMKYYHYRKATKVDSSEDYTSCFDAEQDYLEDIAKHLGSEITASTYNSVASSEKMMYADGTPNPYYIAYMDTSSYFSSLSKEEFNTYTEVNYNVEIDIDDTYIEEAIELNIKRGQVAALTTELFDNNNGALMKAIYMETQSGDVRDLVRLDQSKTTEEILNFVKQNIGYLETLIRVTAFFSRYEDLDPNLNRNEKGIFDTSQGLKRKESFVRIQKTFDQPMSVVDQKSRENLTGFLNDVKKTDQPEMIQVQTAWTKNGLPNPIDIPDYVFKDFVAANTGMYWSDREKSFMPKEYRPADVKRAVKEYLKPFKERKSFIRSVVDVEIVKKEQNIQFNLF